MNGLIDIYQLADKYDIRNLCCSADSRLYTLASSVLQNSGPNTTSTGLFLDCVARVCGPDSLHLVGNRLRDTIIEVCQERCISLFQDKTFLQRYTRGELFDVESAAAFGMDLGGRLLINNGMPAAEANGFPDIKHARGTIPDFEEYVQKISKTIRTVITYS